MPRNRIRGNALGHVIFGMKHGFRNYSAILILHGSLCIAKLSRDMRVYTLTHRRTVHTQASLRGYAVSPELTPIAHTEWGVDNGSG